MMDRELQKETMASPSRIVRKVGIIGNFQSGKSMLINCLLEDRVAVTGGGMSTTKQIVRYCYGEKAGLVVECQGKAVSLPLSLKSLEKAAARQEVTQLVIRLPHPLLRHVELWDTPGFDAEQRDDHLTEEALPKLDAAIFVSLSMKTLDDQQVRLLRKLGEVHLPFVVLLNVNLSQASGSLSMEKQTEAILQRCDKALPVMPMRFRQGERILPVNAPLCWRGILHGKGTQGFSLPEAEGEKRTMKALGSLLSRQNDCLEALGLAVDGEAEEGDRLFWQRLADNVNAVRRLLKPDPIALNHFDAVIRYRQCLRELQGAFEKM